MTSADSQTLALEKMRASCLDAGFIPRSWPEVLAIAKTRLSSTHFANLERYHRSFASYPTATTLKKFYGLCYREGLGDLLRDYRFHRLTRLLTWCELHFPEKASALDIGAGTGTVIRWLRQKKQPSDLSAVDCVPESQNLWQDVAASPKPAQTFDYMLCFDSLGEVNSDDDGVIQNGMPTDLDGLCQAIEMRYGFIHQLKPLVTYLHTGSRIWLTEPIPYLHFWQGLALGMAKLGWQTEILTLPKTASEPDGYLLQIIPF